LPILSSPRNSSKLPGQSIFPFSEPHFFVYSCKRSSTFLAIALPKAAGVRQQLTLFVRFGISSTALLSEPTYKLESFLCVLHTCPTYPSPSPGSFVSSRDGVELHLSPLPFLPLPLLDVYFATPISQRPVPIAITWSGFLVPSIRPPATVCFPFPVIPRNIRLCTPCGNSLPRFLPASLCCRQSLCCCFSLSLPFPPSIFSFRALHLIGEIPPSISSAVNQKLWIPPGPILLN